MQSLHTSRCLLRLKFKIVHFLFFFRINTLIRNLFYFNKKSYFLTFFTLNIYLYNIKESYLYIILSATQLKITKITFKRKIHSKNKDLFPYIDLKS